MSTPTQAAEATPVTAGTRAGAPGPALWVDVGRRYRYVAAAVVALGSMSSILSGTVVIVAVPALQRVFGASLTEIQWILTGYQLGLAAVIPISGYVSDRFGTKRVYVVTLCLFSLASLLCGAAWNTNSLIGFRVLQGLVGGMVMPVGMSMLMIMTPPTERGRMMGMLGVPMLLGPALGPTVGGWLLQVADWKWVFWLNVPVGVLAIILGAIFLRSTGTRRPEPVDMVGLVLATLGVVGMIYGTTQASGHGWASPEALVPLGVGVAFTGLFAAWELRQRYPLLDLRIFREPSFTASMVVNVVLASALFGAVFLVPLFMQQVQGRDPLHAGLLLAAQGIAAAVMMPISGWLTDRYGARPVVAAGATILAAATFLFSLVTPTTGDATWVTLLALRGVGMGFAMMPAMSAAYSRVPHELIARASAIMNTLSRIASSFGIAIFATVAEARITYHVHQAFPQTRGSVSTSADLSHLPMAVVTRLHDAIALGFSDTFLLAGAIALLGLPAAMMLRRPQHGGGDDPARLQVGARRLFWSLSVITGAAFLLVAAIALGIV